MLRVLRVIGKMDRAGAETMIMNIYRCIDRSRIQFDFLVFSKERGDYDDEIEALGGMIYRMESLRGYNYLIFSRRFDRFFDAHPYKIVHGHIGSLANLYVTAAKKKGAYTIVHSHATNSDRFLERIIYQILTYKTRYIADYYFACSRQAGVDRFGKKIVTSGRFKIVKNAIDCEKYRYNLERHEALKRQYGYENKLVIGHVGRMAPEKNHEFIIDIFNDIIKIEKNAVLFLVGRGPEEENIKKTVCQKGLEKKVIFGGVRDDVPDMMNMFDVFVFPSLYEGLGIVGIEAQAAGLPCFFSDAIPNEAVVTKNVCKISLSDSSEKWAKKIIEKVERYNRKDTYDLLVASGYDIKKVAEEMESFYNNVF